MFKSVHLILDGVSNVFGLVQTAVKLKKITPHKLRSTFGTNLYLETGDIYLVADVLGHADVNTTRKHYTATEVELKRKAARKINLRKD